MPALPRGNSRGLGSNGITLPILRKFLINTQGPNCQPARSSKLFDLETELDRGQISVKDLIGVGASPEFEVHAVEDLTSTVDLGLFMIQNNVRPESRLSSLI